mmetsp:Transcript_11364/g.47487  ORF Transcript_11364/g.47487 Transcript_11364/m.47487 type:complete len:243 (+) Transcript_11364:1111-1839(+)
MHPPGMQRAQAHGATPQQPCADHHRLRGPAQPPPHQHIGSGALAEPHRARSHYAGTAARGAGRAGRAACRRAPAAGAGGTPPPAARANATTTTADAAQATRVTAGDTRQRAAVRRHQPARGGTCAVRARASPHAAELVPNRAQPFPTAIRTLATADVRSGTRRCLVRRWRPITCSPAAPSSDRCSGRAAHHRRAAAVTDHQHRAWPHPHRLASDASLNSGDAPPPPTTTGSPFHARPFGACC